MRDILLGRSARADPAQVHGGIVVPRYTGSRELQCRGSAAVGQILHRKLILLYGIHTEYISALNPIHEYNKSRQWSIILKGIVPRRGWSQFG